ncbi:MAG: hypothetical protein ACRD30_01790 [Bryobacteraceae bacterium]
MDFQGTPLNMTCLLVAAIAVTAIFLILKKRYDSNLPLLFYIVALVFTNMTDRAVPPLLLYCGLIFALLLRFEFMNKGFAKVVAFFTAASLGLIVWVFVAEALSGGTAPF